MIVYRNWLSKTEPEANRFGKRINGFLSQLAVKDRTGSVPDRCFSNGIGCEKLTALETGSMVVYRNWLSKANNFGHRINGVPSLTLRFLVNCRSICQWVASCLCCHRCFRRARFSHRFLGAQIMERTREDMDIMYSEGVW